MATWVILHKRAIAQALKVSDPGIDSKICGKGNTGNSGKGAAGHCNNTSLSDGDIEKANLGLVTVLGDKGSVKWPNIKGSGGSKGTKQYESNATPDVAGDIISLSKDEKAIVAGHLAKTVEGGEVVEIRSV